MALLFFVSNPVSATDSEASLPGAPDIVYEQVNAGLDRESIYRIELLVFANRSAYNPSQERFDQPISLSYPGNSLHLFERDEVDPIIAQKLFDIEQLTDTSLNDILGPAANSEPGESTPEIDTTETEKYNAQDKDAEEELAPIPLLRVKGIDSATTRTSNVYKTLKRRSRYRTLYHASWYQALESRATALPVVISGGQQTQERFELEGTIKISKDRFLHIQPELWLVDWVRQSEPLPWYKRGGSGWSIDDLPLRPDTHSVVKALDAVLTSLSPDVDQPSRLESTGEGLDGADAETGEAAISKRYRTAARYLGVNPSNVDRRVDPGNSRDLIAATEAADAANTEQTLAELTPPRPTRIYRLAEKRRVKRDEIHYFDHPLFGVVISVSKWPVIPD